MQFNACYLAYNPVCKHRGQTSCNKCVLSFFTPAAYKVIVFYQVKKLGNVRRVVLQVCIKGDDDVAFRLLEARIKGSSLAKVLFYCNNLQVNEAPLTGESVPVEKNTKKISAETVLANRNNMLYAGTTVVVGNAYGVVTDIGQNTEIGKIATLVKETSQEETPLQNQLKKISRFIGIIVIFVSIFIFSLGFIRNSVGYDLLQIFKTAVAVAVAAIPEGLAISLTVILALGMQHILKRRALVRKLISAETLGSVSVICTDKTGTLTEGRMLLSHLITSNNEFDDGEINLIDISDKNLTAPSFNPSTLKIEDKIIRLPVLRKGNIDELIAEELIEVPSNFYNGPKEGIVIHKYGDSFKQGLRMEKYFNREFREIDNGKSGIDKYVTKRRLIKAVQNLKTYGKNLSFESAASAAAEDILREYKEYKRKELLEAFFKPEIKVLFEERVVPLFQRKKKF